MTPAESGERDRMAYVLDALLATVAVALNAEQVRPAIPPRRQKPRDDPRRWMRVNTARQALRRVAA